MTINAITAPSISKIFQTTSFPYTGTNASGKEIRMVIGFKRIIHIARLFF